MRLVTRRRFLAIFIALNFGLSFPSVSHAFTFWVDYATSYLYRYPNGAVGRVAEMGGTYLRANKQESLAFVQVVALDKNRKFVAASQAEFDRDTRMWGGSVGHFQMEYYQAEFYVNTSRGQVVLKSPVYRWHP